MADTEAQQVLGELEEAEARHVAEQLAKTIDGLRTLADNAEREARQALESIGEYEWSTYERVAGAVVHQIQWGLASINLQRLIQVTGDADRARARGE